MPITGDDVEGVLFGENLTRWHQEDPPGKQTLLKTLNEVASVPGWGSDAVRAWLDGLKLPPIRKTVCGYLWKIAKQKLAAAKAGELPPVTISRRLESTAPSAEVEEAAVDCARECHGKGMSLSDTLAELGARFSGSAAAVAYGELEWKALQGEAEFRSAIG